MNKNIKKIKSEKGSVTLYVLVAILFFLILIIAGYTSSTNKKIAVDKEFNQIKSQYEKEYEIKESQTFINTSIRDTNPEAAMPANSTIIERDASNGIVIQDENKNEWVWVEVPKTTVFTTAQNKTDYTNIENDLIAYAQVYRTGSSEQSYDWKDEWYAVDGDTVVSASSTTLSETQKQLSNGCGLTYDEYNTYYHNMLSSVYTYGGFWISRYEIGDEVATVTNATRTSSTGTSNTPVSKVNQIPYNFVTCSEAQGLANRLKVGNKTSSLLFGIQWDLTCKFLEEKASWDTAIATPQYYLKNDSTSWGNYKNQSLTLSRGKYNTNSSLSTSVWTSFNVDTTNHVTSSQTLNNESYYQLLTTGASEGTNKMNIYDFAGNEWEWTLEHATINNTQPCALRGSLNSLNGSEYPAASREKLNSIAAGDVVAFRSTIY